MFDSMSTSYFPGTLQGHPYPITQRWIPVTRGLLLIILIFAVMSHKSILTGTNCRKQDIRWQDWDEAGEAISLTRPPSAKILKL